ncbi:class I SAM-dependent methyltransferase [Flavimaricola marinus]|uniref:Ubiquinone/menaquinone biosynthesis methyltransferase n=1 Tax=Flavimaricola marinus TaxID=1819565 RepID=A0A238LHY3_9RHOB|nr:class I SAM-dependent methyltransferase [Flavimaricola marinus]SMY09153.1 ubiquinone/menaquinone biosynthesis methyltransferase [Flavimaricola marinus]
MGKLDWDYTNLAKSYLNRPDYADAAIDALVAIAQPPMDEEVLDLGAGVAHLTIKLAERGLRVLALEPNADMRQNGKARTAAIPNIRWQEGVMQDTGLPEASLSLTTYGSSFGVVDRGATLIECARLLVDGGWMACLFNHRDLDDPVQAQVEAIIRERIPGYDYGTRRQDQTQVIEASGLFGPVNRLECPVMHRVSKAVWVEAWRSHATLQRQAGDAFHAIVDEIDAAIDVPLAEDGSDWMDIPYVTRVWMAQRLPRDAG